jgi:hypothetical protein
MTKGKAVAVALFMSVTVSPSWSATTATVQPTGDYDPHHCGFRGDSVTLVVTQDHKPPVKYDFCSAYGISHILQVIKDKAGRTYIFVQYDEGRGPRNTSKYLEIYSLNGDRLNARENQLLDELATFAADRIYTYEMVLPPGGGLKLTFKLDRINSEKWNSLSLPAWETEVGPPPAVEKVIWIDAHP